MTVYMKKLISLVGILGIGFLLIFYAGIQIGRKREESPAIVKEITQTVAVVNMDQGIKLDQGIINYGNQMLNITNQHFYSTSLEDARSGIENGKFAAYIIVPANFSEKVWSINTNPEKSILEYAINPNLQENIIFDVLSDIKGFEMTLNTDISYLYLYSILQEFHSGQTSAELIMKNDKKDLENLNAIIPEQLLQPLVFVELQPVGDYPADTDLYDRYQRINGIMEEMGNQYDTYISWAKQDLRDILDKGQIVTTAIEGLRVTVSDIDLLKDEDGNPLYDEGKEVFFQKLADYNLALAEERAVLTEKFEWLARCDSISTPSEAAPTEATPSEADKNTWLDEIRAEHESQRDEYNQCLKAWRESFDYSMLATPSTPSEAISSEATPSETVPPEYEREWLINRDYNVATLALDKIYERLEADLEELSLDEDQLDEVLRTVWQIHNDEEIVRPSVASASNAYPVSGNPDADLYVREFLDSTPLYEGALSDKLDLISGQIVAFSSGQIEYLAERSFIPLEGLTQLFENVFIGKLDNQEIYLQEILGKNSDKFEEAFDDFIKELQSYTPLQSRDEDILNHFQSGIRENISGIQDDVNEKAKADREYINTLEENQNKDITSLQESLELSYEGTAKNLKEVLNHAKYNREQLNQENQDLLSDFTKKLPYTRNGSVAATKTYDVIANPVVFQEKTIKKKLPLVMNEREAHTGSEWIWGVLIAFIVLLSFQNVYLRKKNKRLKEDSER